jgi:hypothetical protein
MMRAARMLDPADLTPERIDTRVTIVGDPDLFDEDLVAAVHLLATFEDGNQPCAETFVGPDRYLLWRGELTGGVVTAYEVLADRVRTRELSCVLGEPGIRALIRDEFVVRARGDVTERLTRGQWEAELAVLDR